MSTPTNKTWTLLQTRHEYSYKQDMNTPTNKAWALIQTIHEPPYKQDMNTPTNKTWALLQARHEHSYKQDMNPITNKTWVPLQTRHEHSYKKLEEETDGTLMLYCYFFSLKFKSIFEKFGNFAWKWVGLDLLRSIPNFTLCLWKCCRNVQVVLCKTVSTDGNGRRRRLEKSLKISKR